jgi:hypothetical protein
MTYIEAIDAHGGWIASAEDLVRFATTVDGQSGGRALLQPETVQAMLSTPQPPPATAGRAGVGNTQSATGLSWVVKPEACGLAWSHAGAPENTSTSWLIRTPDGLTFAILTNSCPPLGDIGTFFPALITAMRTVMSQAVGPSTPAQVPTATG